MKTTVAIDKEDNEVLTRIAKERGVTKAELMKLLVGAVSGVSDDGEVVVANEVAYDLGDEAEEVPQAADNFHPKVSESPEGRDFDPVAVQGHGRCLACERGGVRKGVYHTCGKGGPVIPGRPMYA